MVFGDAEREYIVGAGLDSSSPQRMKVSATRATIRDVNPETMVSVKAVNQRGLEGWEWSRVKIVKGVSAHSRPGR